METDGRQMSLEERQKTERMLERDRISDRDGERCRLRRKKSGKIKVEMRRGVTEKRKEGREEKREITETEKREIDME